MDVTEISVSGQFFQKLYHVAKVCQSSPGCVRMSTQRFSPVGVILQFAFIIIKIVCIGQDGSGK